MDTFKFASKNGIGALEEELQKMRFEELRAVMLENDLDPCRQFRRTKSPDRIREAILVTTRSRIEKGNGFIG